MSDPSSLDPYAGNILTQGLGTIRSRAEVARCGQSFPSRPKSMEGIPPHIALHHLMLLRDFHVASLEGCRMHETIDLMKRQNYRHLVR